MERPAGATDCTTLMKLARSAPPANRTPPRGKSRSSPAVPVKNTVLVDHRNQTATAAAEAAVSGACSEIRWAWENAIDRDDFEES